MKMHWRSGGMALDAGEWSASRPGRFNPRERRRYPFDRRPGLGPVAKTKHPFHAPAGN
jgi:hypothetical protein